VSTTLYLQPVLNVTEPRPADLLCVAEQLPDNHQYIRLALHSTACLPLSLAHLLFSTLINSLTTPTQPSSCLGPHGMLASARCFTRSTLFCSTLFACAHCFSCSAPACSPLPLAPLTLLLHLPCVMIPGYPNATNVCPTDWSNGQLYPANQIVSPGILFPGCYLESCNRLCR
jgi:hypothetical protein